MEWRDTGILLTTRKHGETSLILDVFTPNHGRHLGVVRGGTSRKLAPVLQPGAQLDLTWRARLEDHMGSFTAEPQRSRATLAMGHRLSLAGLNAVTALVAFCLPEREAHPEFYQQTQNLLDLLDQVDLWPLAYLRWEMSLLNETGFALDLTRCAVTGATTGLCYVSPKTGRAVTQAGAGEWADQLLPLPGVLLGSDPTDTHEIAIALGVTGHFLQQHLAPSLGTRPIPQARATLLDRLNRQSADQSRA
ncbi:MAG: DNA repair protein RecO [Pelagimonas sp.]|jgi:DNA repair protein RecO (recombination protein O)|nr:DNA repair protein RecO [Pelagimonas sp.]